MPKAKAKARVQRREPLGRTWDALNAWLLHPATTAADVRRVLDKEQCRKEGARQSWLVRLHGRLHRLEMRELRHPKTR